MTVSRKAFFKMFGLALAGAGVDLRVLEGACAMPSPATAVGGARFRVQDATAALFREHLGTAFQLRTADGEATRLRLADVSERAVTKNVEQFSLIFHAPPGRTIHGAMHTLQHPALGTFDLFIAPVGALNRRRIVYQACFSRHAGANNTLFGRAGADSIGGRPSRRT